MNNFKNLSYTALGDSITWGQDGIAKKQTIPYCEHVKNILKLKKVTNLGIGWSTMAHLETCSCHDWHNAHDPMCERWNQIPADSDIISISGGVNDRGLSVPIGEIDSRDINTFLGAYNVLLDIIQEVYKNAWIFIMTLTVTKATYKTNLKNEIGKTWEDYDNALIELAKKRKIPILHMSEIKGVIENLRDPNSDGVHPSSDCYKNCIAPAIADFIKNNYEQ